MNYLTEKLGIFIRLPLSIYTNKKLSVYTGFAYRISQITVSHHFLHSLLLPSHPKLLKQTEAQSELTPLKSHLHKLAQWICEQVTLATEASIIQIR